MLYMLLSQMLKPANTTPAKIRNIDRGSAKLQNQLSATKLCWFIDIIKF